MGKIYLKTKQNTGNGWFFLLIITLWLSIRLRPELVHLNTKAAPQNICISSQLTNLPDRLCFLWTSTRDNKMRDYNSNPIKSYYTVCFSFYSPAILPPIWDLNRKLNVGYHLTHKVFEALIRKKMEHSQIT